MKVYSAPSDIFRPDIFEFMREGKLADLMDAEAAYREKIATWARENGEAHPLAGTLLSVPYADGRAEYVVIKTEGKVGLIHLDLGDGWRDERFERTVTQKEIREIIARRERFAKALSMR